MELSFLGDKDFNADWLELLVNDPIHPSVSIEKRIMGNRTVVIATNEGEPQFIICVRIGNKLPKNMEEILADDEWQSKFDIRYAVFYSIFKLPNAILKKTGSEIMKELVLLLKTKGIERFYTLSPIPFLSNHFTKKPSEGEVRRYLEQWLGPVEKFHLSNGARIHQICLNGDTSEQRLKESWGIMVNYDYNG